MGTDLFVLRIDFYGAIVDLIGEEQPKPEADRWHRCGEKYAWAETRGWGTCTWRVRTENVAKVSVKNRVWYLRVKALSLLVQCTMLYFSDNLISKSRLVFP